MPDARAPASTHRVFGPDRKPPMHVIRQPAHLAGTAAVVPGERSSRAVDNVPACVENVVLAGVWPAVTRLPATHWLCIRTMRHGVEDCDLARRRVSIDQDAYLIVNAGQDCRGAYRGQAEVSPCIVYFAPQALARALGAEEPFALAPDAGACGASFRFFESLRAHGDAVGESLDRIARHVEAGDADAVWCEEQSALLLRHALASERALRGATTRIDCVKPATRQELFRRVLLAADFIQSHYEQPISLADIAGAARLSRFHLVRLFRQALGVTPHAYLRDKRLAVARRLIARSVCDLSEIAERTGLGSRSSLFRNLQRQLGASGKALRQRGELTPVPCFRPARDSSTCRIPA